MNSGQRRVSSDSPFEAIAGDGRERAVRTDMTNDVSMSLKRLRTPQRMCGADKPGGEVTSPDERALTPVA